PTGGACRGSCGNRVSRPRARSTDVPVVSSPPLHQSVLPRVRACLARESLTWVKTLYGPADLACQLLHRELNDPGTKAFDAQFWLRSPNGRACITWCLISTVPGMPTAVAWK